MANIEELTQVAAKLTACGEAMIELAKVLVSDPEAPTQETPTQETPTQEPETTYSFTDVRQAAADASRRGYRAEVKALLSKYSIDKLSSLPETSYAAFMKDLEGIGNG